MYQKDIGIVLHNKRWSESSHILTVFCQQFGLLTFLSKGSRRPKSFIANYHKLGSFVECIWQHKRTSDLQQLLSICFQNGPLKLYGIIQRWDILRLLHLVRNTLPIGEIHSVGFLQLQRTIQAIEISPAHSSKLFFQFFIRWMSEIGFGLTVEQCTQCGFLLKGKQIYADIKNGCFVCENCITSYKNSNYGTYVKGETITAMRILEALPESKIKNVKLSITCMNELQTFMKNYLKYHTGVTLSNPLKLSLEAR